ncbi:MAG: ATP-dependent helicase, partial [Flavobacteriia bacterium]|nr:ATP-dependent helicase [Flavobacteriia bacterium]
RTGRGTNKGQALAFCSPEERPLLDAIQVYIETEIEELEINKHDYKAILEDTEDVTYNWQKLLDQANEEDGTSDKW